MSLSVETLAVARKYTDDSLAGAGAVAGVPCKIQSITAITGGNRVTFLWTDNNGDDHTSAMDVMNGVDGEDGKGIQSVTVNAQDHLIITYTDGTTVDAGQIEIHSSVDSVNGQTGAVVLDAEDVGALPDNTPIPSKTSDLTNDSGFATTSDVSTALADYTTTADLTTLLAAKQDTLTFDNAPTENSNNPVKSGGIYAANQTLENNVDVLFETGVKNICPPYSGSYSANGITYIGNSDGTVTVNGTCSANVGANIRVYLKAGQYKVSGCPSGGSYSTYRIGVTTDSWTLIGTHDHGNGTTITIPSDGYYRINLDVRAGYVANNLVFKPMITDVDTPESDYDHYVPYAKTNQELTKDVQPIPTMLNDLGAKNLAPVTYDSIKTALATSSIVLNGNNQAVKNGITLTVVSDSKGNVAKCNVNGTASADTYFRLWVTSALNSFGSDPLNSILYPTKGNYTISSGTDSEDVAFVYQPNISDEYSGCYIRIDNGKTVNVDVYPMLRYASIADDTYAPYAMTNRELTETLTVSKGAPTENTDYIASSDLHYEKYGKVVHVFGNFETNTAILSTDALVTLFTNLPNSNGGMNGTSSQYTLCLLHDNTNDGFSYRCFVSNEGKLVSRYKAIPIGTYFADFTYICQ